MIPDAFWIPFFGFAGVFAAQYLYHRRSMAALAANTRITVAAATGRDNIPQDSTQIEEVVKSVAADKKETKDVAHAVADKVVNAAETVKRALNGQLTETINEVVSQHIEPLKMAFAGMQALFHEHQKSDESNMNEVRSELVAMREATQGARAEVIQTAAKEMAAQSASQAAKQAREEGIKEGRRQVEAEMRKNK